MKPIYEPKGKAKEYGDLAINIYTGCPHSCYYCFAPNVLHREREAFHSVVEPRPGIVEATRQQLEREQITGIKIEYLYEHEMAEARRRNEDKGIHFDDPGGAAIADAMTITASGSARFRSNKQQPNKQERNEEER